MVGVTITDPEQGLNGVDSSEILDVARRTHSLPCIGLLHESDAISLPSSVSVPALRALAESRAVQAALLAGARRIETRLAAAGVRHVFVKGVGISQRYSDPACRPFGDLDVLVLAADVPIVREILQSDGFMEWRLTRRQELFRRLVTNVATTFHLDDGVSVVEVDLQTGLGVVRRHGDDSVALDLILESARSDADVGCAVLDGADALVDLSLSLFLAATDLQYVAERRHQRLRYYADVLLASLKVDGDGWKRFDLLVDLANCRHQVGFSLGLVQRIFPEDVSHELMHRALPAGDCRLDAVAWDRSRRLGGPYLWEGPFWDRILAADLPEDFPSFVNPFP